MVHRVFIPLEPYRFQRMERLERLEIPLLSVILMKDKYPLHIINEIVSMVGLLRDLVYTYEYKDIITSI